MSSELGTGQDGTGCDHDEDEDEDWEEKETRWIEDVDKASADKGAGQIIDVSMKVNPFL